MDSLAVELEIQDDKATIKLDTFRGKLKLVNDDIKQIGGDKSFAPRLTTDLTEISKRADTVHRSLTDVAKLRLGGGQLGAFTREVVRAQERSRFLKDEIINIRRELSNPARKSSIAFLTEELRGAERQLSRLERKLQTVRRETSRPVSAGGGNGFSQGLVDGTGLPLGRAAFGAFLGYQAFQIGEDSLQKIRAARNATLQLKSAAIETGISFETLSGQAEDFGNKTLQSNAKAKESFAQIVNFANAAGRSDKLDLFRQRLADLAAAKGIDPTKLGDITRQLNALTDEATDKLLNANPSAFYDKFARSINKTADSLTDAEKRAAIFDEVIRRGAIFEGSAERKINDTSSAIDKLSLKFDNAKESVGAFLLPLANALNIMTDIAKAEPSLYRSQAENDAIRNNQNILGKAKIDEIVKSLRESDSKIRAALLNPTGSFENFALSRVNISTGFNNDAERQKAIETATQDAQKFLNDLKKRLEYAVSSGDPVLLKFAQKEFQQFSNLFDLDTREKFIKGFSSAITGTFSKAIADAKDNVPKLRQTLRDVFASEALITSDKGNLIKQIEDSIKQAVDAGKTKVKELEKSFLNVFDGLRTRGGQNNPFVLLFSEADKSLETLRENTRGLSKDLISVFEQMEARANSIRLFEARLNNRLSAFDLRDAASDFRSRTVTKSADETKREQEKIIAEFLRNNPNYLYLRGINQVDDAVRLDILSSSFQGRRTLETVNPFAAMQEKLERQISLIYSGRLSGEELGVADRRLINLTNGLNPLELTANIREQAAQAREREAARLEAAEKDARRERAESLEIQKRIADEMTKLRQIAEKEGFRGVVEIIDKSNGAVNVSNNNPTQADVKKTYFDEYSNQ